MDRYLAGAVDRPVAHGLGLGAAITGPGNRLKTSSHYLKGLPQQKQEATGVEQGKKSLEQVKGMGGDVHGPVFAPGRWDPSIIAARPQIRWSRASRPKGWCTLPRRRGRPTRGDWCPWLVGKLYKS